MPTSLSGDRPALDSEGAGLLQHTLIERVRALCVKDQRLGAALMYGSFVRGGADRYSDIEFWLFCEDASYEQLDPDAWISRVGAVYDIVVGESGANIALFRPSLVRGEFHFAPLSSLDQVRSWTALGVTAGNLDRMVVVDRDGRLRAALATLVEVPSAPSAGVEVQVMCGRFIDWHVFAVGVLARGEVARAHMLLGILHSYLARMARLCHGQLGHWATPTRSFEAELPPEVQERYRACTSAADRQQLIEAFQNVWMWGSEQLVLLAERHGFTVPDGLVLAVEERTRALLPHSRSTLSQG